MNSKESGVASARDSESLLAITLCSSNAPIEMPTLTDDRLRGFALFKSHRREDGRERFRLHLGYFQTSAEAELVLAVLRPRWPRALIAAVPDASLGSLENTAMTRFTIVQPPSPAATEPQPSPVATAKVILLGAKPLPAPVTSQPAPRVQAPNLAREVATLGATSAPPAASKPVVAEASPRPAPQRYAVQLVFGREPMDLASLPDLAIYGGYLLYAIETQAGDRRLYGIRLGFYDDVLSARLVAQYVRSEFRDVTIVPVSEREVARATEAQIRQQALRSARARPASSLPTWPRSALTVTFDPASHLPLAT